MEIEYSTLDTIESYDRLFYDFSNRREQYDLLNKNKRLIYLAAGLGLSNSIHEKFIKSVIEEYKAVYSLSNNKRNKIINTYKAPKKVKEFVELFGLNLDEAFELNKLEIQSKFNIIDSVDNLLNIISEQRDVRNNYLHGDFNFSEDILFDTFKMHIIEFQELHSFILKIIRYSFISNRENLPDISLAI